MREQILDWLDKLRQSTLQAADLQTALDQTPRQQLLYLRAGSIGVDSTVTGMALECDDQVHERPQDPADWPYQTVLAAIYSWLCNADYEHTGGQCWPCGAPEKLDCDQEGLPQGLRRHG